MYSCVSKVLKTSTYILYYLISYPLYINYTKHDSCGDDEKQQKPFI